MQGEPGKQKIQYTVEQLISNMITPCMQGSWFSYTSGDTEFIDIWGHSCNNGIWVNNFTLSQTMMFVKIKHKINGTFMTDCSNVLGPLLGGTLTTAVGFQMATTVRLYYT